MTIEEWDSAIYLGLAVELTDEEFGAIRQWQADGEETFAAIELYSCRRVFFAIAPGMTDDALRTLIRLRL